MSGHVHARDLLQKLSGQVESAEVYEVCSRESPVRFTAGALESIRSVETTGRALRLVRGGRVGFSASSDLDDATLLPQSALAAAEFGGPATFAFPGDRPPAQAPCFDPEVERMSEGEMIALGKEAVAAILAAHPDVQVDAEIERVVEEVRLVNTSGLDHSDRRTRLAIGISAQRSREGDILFVDGDLTSRRRQDIAAGPLAAYITERLHLAQRLVQARPGAMPVAFRRSALLALFLPLLEGLNGRNVIQGASPLSDKVGQAVFDPAFEVTDDGSLGYAWRTAPRDDEGVPTSRKALIAGGVVRQFLYDLRTAGEAGTESTGNGFKRGFFSGGVNSAPGIFPGTWLVSPGPDSLETILRGLDEALLVESILGMGQGNVMAGEFSNNVALGFLVRRGEIVGRVKNTMIAGNVYSLLKDHLLAVADEPEQIYAWLRSPAIVLDAVGIAC